MGMILLKRTKLTNLINTKASCGNSQKTPNAKRRKLLVQKGGFLPALLMQILGIAGQLLMDSIVNRK